MPEKILGGRYRILQPLGSGGFGETFLAEDTQFPGNPQCVVKKLKPQLENPKIWPDACRLFQREAEILSKLGDHDQIPRLLAHFQEEEHFFLVQELINGSDLSREIISGQQCAEYYAVALLDGILEVLEYVHQQGVIHRDIKPSNLMRRQQDGRIILIDFGAVKAVGLQTTIAHGNTAQTISICTPGYTPNEQYSGQPKLSSDVFAVGMVGIQALTGKLPSELDKDPQTGEVIWTDYANVSPHLAKIINKMVLYDFRHRYQNATGARVALQPLLSTQPVSVPAPTGAPVASVVSNINHPSQLLTPASAVQTTSMKPKLPIRTFFSALFLGLLGGAAGAVYVTARFFPTAFAPKIANEPPESVGIEMEGGPGEEFTAEAPDLDEEKPAKSATDAPEAIAAANTPVVVDYTPLKESLTAGQWKNSDQITRDLLLSITGRAGTTLRVEDVEQIPCKDLRQINQYWEKSSQGRFGFKAQAKVWQNLVGKFTENTNVERNNSDSALNEFVQRTRWFYIRPYSNNLTSYEYGKLVFALNAPPGHLTVRAFLPVDSPNDSTNLKGAVGLIPTLSQRVSFCEKQPAPPTS